MVWLKSKHEIDLMRVSGKLTEQTLNAVRDIIKPGITTKEIDAFAEDFILQHGGKPSFKNYNGYPASVCASVNDVVVHGIPGNTKLCEGDIISVDIGVLKDGFHGDAARTFAVGSISDEAKRLIEVTEKCFFEGIKFAKDGQRLGDIGSAIQDLAESNGYGVVRKLVGHGIGTKMHEDPDVPNFGRAGHGMRLRSGMTIAVEPMINMGTYDVFMESDGWTVRTKDGKLSAHYENTIAITDGEPEILTLTD
ncbi:MAG: type I methionyl aminopeptidase [Clostridia bacterium]|nr:type I methionyl aminopeptidase [Clostridia bacterium]